MTHIEISAPLRRRTFGLALTLSVASFAFAQEKKSVSGTIKSSNGTGVPYASVVFKNTSNSTVNDAALTDEKGNYTVTLAPGNYTVTVEAVDFKNYSSKISITGKNVPAIVLTSQMGAQKTNEIGEVTLVATSKAYKVELDKKVYDPSSDLISKGGSLQDVLTNVPSVSVDTDGTISMRGSSNVRILINGKPSALLGIDDGESALRSIPADQIERVEVITNPSSKFEAAGTAGILNIILKKDKKMGFNGSVVGAVGYLPQTMLNTNLNWRKGNLTWFINGGGSYRKNKNTNNYFATYKNISTTGQVTDMEQLAATYNEQNNFNGSAGLLYDFSEKTSANASFTIRGFEETKNGNTDIIENLFNTATRYSNRTENGTGKNNAMQVDFGVDHKFNKKGHNLSLAVSLQKNKFEGQSVMTETGGTTTQNDALSQNRNQETLLGKLDYELPIGENSRLEVGYRLDINQNKYNNILDTDSSLGSIQNVVDLYSNNTIYKEIFNSGYIQFKSKIGNFGYQLGLRNENTHIDIDYKNNAGETLVKTKNYNDLFPSIYLSYDLGKNNQILVNYSRRIDRPRSFFLVPYGRYTSPRTLFAGNIDLNPSYVDSYELGYSYSKGKITINPTLYLRQKHDEDRIVAYRKDERLNTITSVPINNGTNTSYGLDLNFTADILPWWKIMGNVNLFGYKSEGNYTFDVIDANGLVAKRYRDFSGEGFSTISRLTSSFKIDKTFSFQLQGFYRGAEKTASTQRKNTYSINFGASKTIWNGNGTIAFNIQDIFNTRHMNSYTFSDVMDSNSYMQMNPRQFSLSFTYRFKQGEKIEPVRKKVERMSDDQDDTPVM